MPAAPGSRNPVLEGEIVPSAAPPPPSIAKVRYTHDAMIDMLLANPGIRQNDLAEIFGYSAAWISTIMSSDAFKARFAERRIELVDPLLSERVRVNFEGLVLRSQEILQEKLSMPTAKISDSLALRTFELATRAAGYGLKQAPVSQVETTVHLNILQSNLTKMLREARPDDASEAEDDDED